MRRHTELVKPSKEFVFESEFDAVDVLMARHP